VRRVVLEVVDADKKAGVFFVVSGWGEKADWYKNIKASPKIRYQVGRQRYAGTAEQLPCEDAEQVFLTYGSKHPRMLQELMRFVGYRIEASEEAYRALAIHLPVVKLSPELKGG
jgi:deazaflavin-dependent oxidoreductase (nitroreductase family)